MCNPENYKTSSNKNVVPLKPCSHCENYLTFIEVGTFSRLVSMARTPISELKLVSALYICSACGSIISIKD
jgi:hypothetical protein